MSAHSAKRARLVIALVLVLLVGTLAYRAFTTGSSKANPTPEAARERPSATDLPGTPEQAHGDPKTPPATLKEPAAAAPAKPDTSLLSALKRFHQALRAGLSRDAALATLAELKRQVHALPPDVAAATLIALLRSGEDAATGLGFVVGQEGVLDEPPTFRVALLDLLGQTEPYMAVSFSREVLNQTAQPDEYAIGLRNLAWLDHENDLTGEIVSAFSNMLDRADWRAKPTAGYLEAFDVAVAVGGPTMVGELASVLRLGAEGEKNAASAVNRAAFIALDRIMLREPETIARLFNADPTLLDYAPNHRASLLSRLDPEAPLQAATLRTYLLSRPEGPELEYFTKIFPNGNFFEGNRLVSAWETSASDLIIANRDKAAIRFVESLLQDPAAAKIAPRLEAIRERLLSFTKNP